MNTSATTASGAYPIAPLDVVRAYNSINYGYIYIFAPSVQSRVNPVQRNAPSFFLNGFIARTALVTPMVWDTTGKFLAMALILVRSCKIWPNCSIILAPGLGLRQVQGGDPPGLI